MVGRANVVDLLIKNGADVNATDHISRSSLYLAAERGDQVYLKTNTKTTTSQ